MIPTWKKDLDALVTETIAFAANVKKLAQPKQVATLVADRTASGAGTKSEIVQADAPVLATLEETAPAPFPEETWPARLLPMTVLPSERDEIKQRLANFKAHQLRLQTERETYYSQTMARTRDLTARLRPTKDR
jgi:hypothetical protein